MLWGEYVIIWRTMRTQPQPSIVRFTTMFMGHSVLTACFSLVHRHKLIVVSHRYCLHWNFSSYTPHSTPLRHIVHHTSNYSTDNLSRPELRSAESPPAAKPTLPYNSIAYYIWLVHMYIFIAWGTCLYRSFANGCSAHLCYQAACMCVCVCVSALPFDDIIFARSTRSQCAWCRYVMCARFVCVHMCAIRTIAIHYANSRTRISLRELWMKLCYADMPKTHVAEIVGKSVESMHISMHVWVSLALSLTVLCTICI